MTDPQDPTQPPATPPTPPPPPPPYGAAPPPPPPPPPAPYYGAPSYGDPYSAAYGAPANPYAHWGLRVGAYLLDALLLIPFYFVTIVGVYAGGTDADGSISAAAVLAMVVGYGAAIAFAIWNQIVRQGRTGQSLGKQWVGIRVVHESNGQPLGGWLTFGRYLLHFLDSLACYLGWLWPIWDAKRQTFADKIVKSVVVRQVTALPS